MTHTKKWITISVLAIILALTTNTCYAASYTADDTYVIPTQYHDLFNNYFNNSSSYKYFSYKCDYGNYSRHCYYGIDNDNNYLKIDYVSSNNSYDVQFTQGVDQEFSVIGVNVYEHEVKDTKVTNVILVFALCLYVFIALLGVVR